MAHAAATSLPPPGWHDPPLPSRAGRSPAHLTNGHSCCITHGRSTSRLGDTDRPALLALSAPTPAPYWPVQGAAYDIPGMKGMRAVTSMLIINYEFGKPEHGYFDDAGLVTNIVTKRYLGPRPSQATVDYDGVICRWRAPGSRGPAPCPRRLGEACSAPQHGVGGVHPQHVPLAPDNSDARGQPLRAVGGSSGHLHCVVCSLHAQSAG